MNPEFLNAYFRVPKWPLVVPEEFVIVTAFNPEGSVKDDSTNRALDAKLEDYLRCRALTPWRVIGGSHDLKHAEPGYAFGTDLENGIKIGVQFKQLAVFWVQRGLLYLVDCSTRHPTPMGEWRARILM